MAVLSLPSNRKAPKYPKKHFAFCDAKSLTYGNADALFLSTELPVCLFSLIAYYLLYFVFPPDNKVSSITIKAVLVNFYQHKLESSGNLN